MKLWEAILKGSKMKPQCFGLLYSEKGGSCALGAALDGLDIRGADSYKSLVDLNTIHPLLTKDITCPVCNLSRDEREAARAISAFVPHLNDDHKWSRECIAYWIRDTFEKEPEVIKEPVQEKTYASVS